MAYTTEVSTFTDALNATNTRTFVKPSPVPSAITFTLGVVGNIIAIFVLVRSSDRHKWNVFYRFVTALAITDLFGILTSSPVAFAVYDNNLKWVGGEPLCHYMSFMLIFSGLATVLLVGAMALDRYLAILHPFKYNSASRYTIVNFVIFGIWLFSVLIAALPLFGLGENVKQFPQTWCFFNFFGDRTEDEFYAYFYSALGLGTIFLTAVLNVCVILGLITGKRSQIRRGSVTSRKARTRTDVYITIFLVAICVVFAVCWAPFLVRIIINQSRTVSRNIKADLLTLRLATLNQILDPWVYILFRREMLSKFAFCCKTQGQDSLFRRLVSFTTGSFRSNTPTTETSTNGTPVPQRRHIISIAARLPQESYKDDSRDSDNNNQDETIDETLMSQDNM
ncbi:prostaglandin E2 receptor EP4 subtype-like [Mytilus galloprovincialis]|uniref:prostaglandin E2 receptor EP4 subtype-like n=1 Tax=Mytilus galloprovincialis TaxID=29158 RepID=UPI003F7C4D9C